MRLLCGLSVVLFGCGESVPTEVAAPEPIQAGLQQYVCTADIRAASVKCGTPVTPAGVQPIMIGGQNTNVRLTSSNVAYNPADSIFSFDVTITNLLNEAIGTPDGTVPDPEGIQVFFHTGPTVTEGSGTIFVWNRDGTGTFTAAGQPFFSYNEILASNATSAAKTWQLRIPPEVQQFSFTVYLETEIQPLLVINEVMVNPAASTDTDMEWFEVYNAGSKAVNLQNLVIADSAASGRRPYHLISSPVVVPAGGYVVLGNNTNTTSNGGVPVDYAYGSALALANSLDAVKVARVFGTDTLTIDRVQFSSAGTSAKAGISRELKNPALDNTNMDGSNWADALVTAVYGAGGRGTPKAQNSSFTP